MDADFYIDTQCTPPKRYYTVVVKLLHPELFANEDQLEEALQEPRESELEIQMSGYRVMRDLISSPKSKCWGRVFKHLYPLARDVCNGCPADPEGRITTDERYQLRMKPAMSLSPYKPCRRLYRHMGSFEMLIVNRSCTGPCSLTEVSALADKVALNQIGVMVVPKRFAFDVNVPGMLLSYEEFFYAADHCPYLMYRGVVCVLEDDAKENDRLFRSAEKLLPFQYRAILYCCESTMIASKRKPIRDCMEGYIIPLDKM